MARIDDVKKLAELARISIPEERLPKLVAEFDQVLSYVGQLESLSVERGTELLPYKNVFREDAVTNAPGTHTEALAAQFPQRSGNSLSVKKIISHD